MKKKDQPQWKKDLKQMKSSIIQGFGRAIGFLILYLIIALILKANGIQINITDYPPLVGEITKTITK